MITKCTHCGSVTNPSDMYCTNCGQKLEPLNTDPSTVDVAPNDDLEPFPSFSTVMANVIYILVIKWFTLPIQIVKNSYLILSEYKSGKSNNKVLSRDFPIYTWFIYLFDCWILLTYPLGSISLIYSFSKLAKEEESGSDLFFLIAVLYFSPIIYGLIKECVQIVLISLQKLYVIADRESSL